MADGGLSIDLGSEIEALKKKIEQANLPKDLKLKAEGMLFRLVKMSQKGNFSQEFEPVSEYINWVTKLPFGKTTPENFDIKHAREVLDKYNYGLEPVKSRVMEYLAVIKLQRDGIPGGIKVPSSNSQVPNNEATLQQPVQAPVTQPGQQVVPQTVPQQQVTPVAAPVAQQTVDTSDEMKRLQGSSSHAPILCFVGIQGVGKTSMAKAIANALDRKFVRIALGALGSVTEIRGISRGQINAEPGQIIKSLIRTESMNPLILLDEIDKVSSDTGLRSDVMAALLEILDPEQNSTFMDKYLDYPIDLSKVMFITTANNLGGISAALLDRLEVIRFGSYSDDDKIVIAKNYLLPKVRAATGLTEAQLSFDDNVWELIIRPFGFDAGVRQLERTLTELARKVALQIVQGITTGAHLTKDNFRQYIPEDIGIYS